MSQVQKQLFNDQVFNFPFDFDSPDSAVSEALHPDVKIEKELKQVRQQLNTCNLENKALRQEIERIRNR